MKKIVSVGFLSSAAAFLLLACGSPTLEEACEEYCEWAKTTDCGDAIPSECSAGCGQIEKALKDAGHGDCIQQYTDLFDCSSGSDFTCFSGVPVPTDCVEEALDLSECIGVENDG